MKCMLYAKCHCSVLWSYLERNDRMNFTLHVSLYIHISIPQNSSTFRDEKWGRLDGWNSTSLYDYFSFTLCKECLIIIGDYPSEYGMNFHCFWECFCLHLQGLLSKTLDVYSSPRQLFAPECFIRCLHEIFHLSVHNNPIHILHSPFPIKLKSDNRTGWQNICSPDLYSGGLDFESWLGHGLSGLRFFVVFVRPSGQVPDNTSIMSRPDPSKFFSNSSFIYHTTILCVSVATDGVVKYPLPERRTLID
jgi:hypothetical protein